MVRDPAPDHGTRSLPRHAAKTAPRCRRGVSSGPVGLVHRPHPTPPRDRVPPPSPARLSSRASRAADRRRRGRPSRTSRRVKPSRGRGSSRQAARMVRATVAVAPARERKRLVLAFRGEDDERGPPAERPSRGHPHHVARWAYPPRAIETPSGRPAIQTLVAYPRPRETGRAGRGACRPGLRSLPEPGPEHAEECDPGKVRGEVDPRRRVAHPRNRSTCTRRRAGAHVSRALGGGNDPPDRRGISAG